MFDRTILSLCDYTGVWSDPYKNSGYNVIQVDIAHEQDVRLMMLPECPVHGILAAPPCTCFACSGNRWKRSDAEMIDALSIVDACLRFVVMCRPNFWALENPVGKLRRYLGKPKFYFNPCDYGDFGEAYTKKTCLWGEFTPPQPRKQLTPIRKISGNHSQDLYLRSQGKKLGCNKNRARLRSVTPRGFAQAFFEANP